jgi:hypothetical protein
LAALLCVVLYAGAVEMHLRTSTEYVTIIARNHIWLSHVLMAIYGLLYIPTAFAAAHLVLRLHDGGRS